MVIRVKYLRCYQQHCGELKMVAWGIFSSLSFFRGLAGLLQKTCFRFIHQIPPVYFSRSPSVKIAGVFFTKIARQVLFFFIRRAIKSALRNALMNNPRSNIRRIYVSKNCCSIISSSKVHPLLNSSQNESYWNGGNFLAESWMCDHHF